MKNDQYFPHEVSMRQTNEVISLIEEQGMAGYGIYWGLIEYLRAQDNYVGDLRALRTLAAQFRTTVNRLLKILKDYGLFDVSDFTFRSRRLEESMKPLEKKRSMKTVRSSDDDEAIDKRNPCNYLKINDGISTVKKSKEKKRKENSSSAEEECRAAAEAVASLSKKLAWEEYVDELDGDESWKELMAMRSGMKRQFFPLYPRIVKSFKNHVRCMGKEHHILSLGDAKRYFCFFVNPGSATYIRLLDELKQQEDDDPYRFEYRDKETGKRMYCGLVIPDEAPPRPSEQAVWNPEKKIWFY